MKKSRLKPISNKLRKEKRQYAILRKEFLEAHPICAVCKERSATEIHHKCGRGRHHLSVETWLSVCGGGDGCHHKIHFGATIQMPESDRHYEEWARECGTEQVFYGPRWARHFGYLE